MIYVIRTKYSSCTLLKIGYTRDDNFDTRMSQYKMHNPLYEIVYKISEGDEEDEKSLHWLFRKHLYQGSKEWFYEDQTIYEFFNLNKTKHDLDNNLPKHTTQETYHQIESRLQKFITKVVNRWLCLISKDVESLNKNYNNYKSYIKDCRNEIGKSIKEESDILDYLSSKYSIPEDIQIQVQDFLDNKLNNSSKINNFLLNFNSLLLFREKMSLLCETNFTEQELGIVLDQIPLEFRNYYQTLGPERCKALSYDVTYISREYSDLQFDKSKLQEKIYKTFQVNSKYSKSNIKETLGVIYSSLGYNKTPKANDLEEYFEIKLCKVLDRTTGKFDNGFKIIKLKEKQENDIPNK